MRKFEFFAPTSLAEALDLLEKFGAKAKVIAGGTDLLVQMKSKLVTPEVLISLMKIPQLTGIGQNGKGMEIGALVKHAQIEKDPIIRGKWGLLASAARKVGSPQIRNLGTVGGNLGNASPAADSAPPLLVLEAEINLISKRGERRLPVESFFTGPRLTGMAADEIIKDIQIPEIPAAGVWTYLKLGRRKSMDLAIASAAVLLTLDPLMKICRQARIALGAVAPTPMRAKAAERFLEGKALDEGVIQEAGEIASRECRPISDIRAAAEHRREMVKILVERAVKKSIGVAIPPTGI